MNMLKIPFLLCVTLILAISTIGANVVLADENTSSAPVVSTKEMPLLRGGTWLNMTQDEKTAFVWGMGHIITMERERTEQFPELKKESFAAKMAEGLAGMPMNEVVGVVDQFYKDNPDKSAEPVVKVLWMQLVRPKLIGSETNPPTGK